MLHASFVGKKGHSVPECSWRYDLSYFCEESWHSCAQNQHLHAFVATSSTSKDDAQNDDSGASDHINADLLDMHVNSEYQGGRREDDWTCPSCGNVNFSFRTTCNMRNCTQPRPADHNSKSAAKTVQAPQSFLSSAPYVGSGALSSMYMGMSPYGSSLFNGIPFTGGSAYHYNYGSRFAGGSPYRPLHLSGPAPYSSGPMMANGGMYGVPAMMDRYGLALPMGPAMGPRPGFFPEDEPQKKGGGGMRDDDWKCPKCGNVNYSFRTVCNMRKCNTPKPESQSGRSGKIAKQDMPEGSWKCEKCNNINYPFRTQCNRQNCGADKPSDLLNSSPGASENDQ